MFTAKEIVKELIESTGDNRWFINTKTIGTQVGHRHLPNLSIQRHVSEAVKRLTAKQKKIAAMAGDKNKIDAEDLAKLRSMKEEQNVDEGIVDTIKNVVKTVKDSRKPEPQKDYREDPAKAAAARKKVFEEEAVNEKAPPGWEGTVKKMKKHKEIDNPWALAWSMKKKGYKSHVKEEAEQIDESAHSIVNNLKADGRHKEAGAAAFKHGLGRKYGQHFGMRDTKDKDEAAFHAGYDRAEAESRKSVKEEVEQIDEASDPTKGWLQAHTKGTKAMRDRLDKMHAKNPKYQAFKKSLEGHSAGPAEKPKAAPKAEPKSAAPEETPAQKLRRINMERTKKALELGKAHQSGGVGSAGTSSNQSPLEKKLGGHDISHLEKKKTTAIGASPAERENAKAEKKEKEKSEQGERKTKRLTGRDLKEMIQRRRG